MRYNEEALAQSAGAFYLECIRFESRAVARDAEFRKFPEFHGSIP